MDYRENTGEAVSWRRACGVTITNPYGGQEAPQILFQEEDAIRLNGKVHLNRLVGPTRVRGGFDPGETFPLVHPETGAEIGSSSHEQLYVLLHSLYLHLAAQQDQQEERWALQNQGAVTTVTGAD